jgi:hypothetical protein
MELDFSPVTFKIGIYTKSHHHAAIVSQSAAFEWRASNPVIRPGNI